MNFLFMYILLGSRVKIPLKITYMSVAKVMRMGTRFFVIKLFQTMSCFRFLPPIEKLPVAANIHSEFSDCQYWCHWQRIAAWYQW